ncbi:TPA: hypothetical protein QDZ12_006041 [Pseudomonas putida]|uniref:hypothetical protein n=1 Tax=Pseudomonas sp. HD6515 TaxID=2856556 RepID=UPI00217EEA8A|nr:hypothetical protein [Pseudomonas sp. HD6515]ELS0924336.1 hypothetical protein [Pseudomonas putida]UWH21905.1 hypothetical protein KW568_23455 [Pseudomonas sp. HD6515]HDS0942672.1 hypothetical protein [Pseudomonas putida]
MKRKVDTIIANDDFHEAVKTVKEAIELHPWLRKAYMSFYRSDIQISLCGAASLDDSNFEILRLILKLRGFEGWRDSDLYDLEQFAKQLK